MVALVVSVTLVSVAVWAACAISGETPACVPETAAQPTLGAAKPSGESVVVAHVDDLDVLLPVAQEFTTAVAFHPVDSVSAVPFTPVGERVAGGDLRRRLADIFAGGGGMQYYLMPGTAANASAPTAGLSVGAVPGSPVVSPVDGKITAVKRYSILGRYNDVEINIRLAADPSLLLVVTHVAKPKAEIGALVQRGVSTLGTVRALPATLDQPLRRYTTDNGDHVQLMLVHVTPELTGT